MDEKVTSENCAYSFDEVKSPDRVYCCKHKKSMHCLDSCEDGKEN